MADISKRQQEIFDFIRKNGEVSNQEIRAHIQEAFRIMIVMSRGG